MARALKASTVVLLGILALAIVLRAIGLAWGLPFSYYFDEDHVVKRAVQMGSGDFNPHWFHKPALLYYLLFVEYGIYYVAGRITGAFGAVEDFAVHFVLHTGVFYAIGRVTVCTLGVATVWIVYRAGARLYDRTAGLVAALVLAVTAGHVASCQVVKEDVPAAFFTALSILLLSRFLHTGKSRDLAWSGLVAGLGTATKYYPIVLALPIALAPWIRARARREPERLRRAWIGPALTLAGFFAGSPYNFLDSTWVRETWRVRILPILGKSPYAASDATYHGQGLLASARDFVASIAAPDALGVVVAAAALAALIFLIVKRRPADLILLAALLPFAVLAIVANPSATEARHLNLAFVVLTLACGRGASALVTRLRLDRSIATQGAAVAIGCVALVPAVVAVARHDRLLTRVDARARARRWIESHIPAGTKILANTNSLQLVDSEQNVADLFRRAEALKGEGPWTAHLDDYYRIRLAASRRYRGPTYDLLVLYEPWWKSSEGEWNAVTDPAMTNPLLVRDAEPLDAYRARGFRYFVSLENVKGKYLVEPMRKSFPHFANFYEAVDRELAVEIEFVDPENPLPDGPLVRIYRF
ncbi:MAG: glycosyltransferase family 39 protein [Planctomycetes bacterium]|nr:glycosyltransferase family 39 protein [Planctomycetota bacterium]